METKVLLTVLSAAIGLAGFVPYYIDTLKRKTEPHVYTWLIWSITQGVATAGIWYGGGGIVAIAWVIGTVGVFGVFLLSLAYGTKNITRFDTVVLVFALVAVGIWVFLDQPVLSVLMVTLIDLVGYIPSYRKAYKDPGTETMRTYVLFIIGNAVSIAALAEYNLLTLTYLIAIGCANIVMTILLIVRRKALKTGGTASS